MKTGSKLCPVECTQLQGFSKIWPSDLVHNLTWPSLKLPLDFTQINILKQEMLQYVTNAPEGPL